MLFSEYLSLEGQIKDDALVIVCTMMISITLAIIS